MPAYDELVIVAHRDAIHEARIRKFLHRPAGRGVGYLRAHPQKELGGAFAAAHPELRTELNHQAWLQTVPLFATDPAALDKPRYETCERFLYNNKLVKKSYTFNKLCGGTALSLAIADGRHSVSDCFIAAIKI